jgi:phage-related protein
VFKTKDLFPRLTCFANSEYLRRSRKIRFQTEDSYGSIHLRRILHRVNKYTKNKYTSQQYPDKVDSSSSLADVVWLGDSLDVLRSFPSAMQGDLGYALEQVQRGQMPPDSKPMRTVGPGVYELRDQDERAWYRVFYLKKIAGVIYVLHCFEKRTAQTAQKDIKVAQERLKRLNEEQRTQEKHKTGGSSNQGKRS